MEFEIKNLDFETLIKLANNAIDLLERIAKALETLAVETVAENETL